jgi:hypothetical protein
VFTLVADQCRDVDANFRILRATQATGSQRQHFRYARPALQQDAQNDRLAWRRVVDHVSHAGQDCESCRLRIARHRWFERLPFDLEETNRLAC